MLPTQKYFYSDVQEINSINTQTLPENYRRMKNTNLMIIINKY